MAKHRQPNGKPAMIGPSGGPNSVREAANAYLKAAETLYQKEAMRSGFWYVPEWYVVHHLAYLSVELFLKAFTAHAVTDTFSSDPENIYLQTESGHEALSAANAPRLLKALHPNQVLTLQKLSKAELCKGRYPYEPIQVPNSQELVERFPAGETGKNLTDEWMELARALRDFWG